MSIHARPLTDVVNGPPSWFPVEPGRPCDLTLEIADHLSGTCVDWSGHVPRFRVYSQYVDRCVVFETTDPQRCVFEPDGIWKLHLTAEETAALPRGGMIYTLEHLDSDGNWQLGIRAGLSCRDARERTAQPSPMNSPHYNARHKRAETVPSRVKNLRKRT